MLVYYEAFASILAQIYSEEDDHDIHKDVASNCFINGLVDVLQDRVNTRKIADDFLRDYTADQADEAVLRCCKIALAEEQSLAKAGKAFLMRRQPAATQPNQSHQRVPNNRFSYNSSSRPGWSTHQQPKPASNSTKPVTTTNTTAASTGTSSNVPYDRSRDGKPPVTCYNCGIKGHPARLCRKPARASFNMFDVLEDNVEHNEDDQSKK